MKDMMQYKGYFGSTHYSDEDAVFYGKIEFVRSLVTYEGNTIKSLQKSFKEAVDDYLAMCKKEEIVPEESFKGSFNVRTGSELHRLAVLAARERGMNLNQIVTEALEKHLKKPSRRPVKVGKYNLQKTKLEQLHKEERLFFIQILNFLNDLNTFQNLLFLSRGQKDSSNEVETGGQEVMSFSIALKLIGVMCEGWILIVKATEQEALREYRSIKTGHLKDFEKQFGKNGRFTRVRNKFIYHYDPKDIEDYFRKAEIIGFNLYLSDPFGFSFSTIYHLTMLSIFRELGLDPEKEGPKICFDKTFDLILNSAKSFKPFIIEYVNVVLKNLSLKN